MAFSYKAVHLSENPCYTLSRSGLIESPYIQTTRTRFVQPGKIEIDANERAAIGKRNAAFSFAPSSILSLTSCRTLFSSAFCKHTIRSLRKCVRMYKSEDFMYRGSFRRLFASQLRGLLSYLYAVNMLLLYLLH